MSVSKKYQYKIVLSAPIGEKEGFLTAEILNDKIEGKLTVMNHDNYFCGEYNDDSCFIEGMIVTLTGVFQYFGSGHLDEKYIKLVLNIGRKNMLIRGERI